MLGKFSGTWSFRLNSECVPLTTMLHLLLPQPARIATVMFPVASPHRAGPALGRSVQHASASARHTGRRLLRSIIDNDSIKCRQRIPSGKSRQHLGRCVEYESTADVYCVNKRCCTTRLKISFRKPQQSGRILVRLRSAAVPQQPSKVENGDESARLNHDVIDDKAKLGKVGPSWSQGCVIDRRLHLPPFEPHVPTAFNT